MKFVNIVTDNSVMVLNTYNGNQVKFFSGDSRYDTALDLIRDGDFESVFELDVKHMVTSFITELDDDDYITIKIEDGCGIVVLHDHDDVEVELHDALVARIIKMREQAFDAQPLVNFIGRLYSNPSKTAIDELYLFIEACSLPITEDGCFIAYKIVRSDYMDIYTGTMDNSVGNVLSMPRALVDDNRNNTCSKGLHFCSKEYLRHYGSGARAADRCMLVKIDPADVVSIPSDYNNAKGRAWMYEVIGEVEGNWRDWLPETDYTDRAVVSTPKVEEVKELWEGNDGSQIQIDRCFDGSKYQANVTFIKVGDDFNDQVDEGQKVNHFYVQGGYTYFTPYAGPHCGGLKLGYSFDSVLERYRNDSTGKLVKKSEATF